MGKKYFGTDGIRGKVGEKPITPDFLLKIGWAIGKILADNGEKKIILGKDTRISGYMLEAALEAGIVSSGVSVYLTGPMPTPGIAYLTRTLRANAGIVLSASHNPFNYNGIKFFSKYGTKLSDNTEKIIEKKIEKPIICVSSKKLGRANRIIDAAGRYIEFCKATFPSTLNLNKLKIVIDCANGATYHIAPNVLRELGAEIIKIGCKPNGININHKCGATNINFIKKIVLLKKADIGLALDGDGDRIIMIDHFGNIISGDQIVYIIARDNLIKNKENKGVVGTIMSNLGLEIALKKLNIPFVRSEIGDRYVLEKLKKRKWIIGAENSGHIMLLDKTTTGDGIIASLQVLTIMVRRNMTLYALCNDIKLFPQYYANIKIHDNINVLENNKIKNIISSVKKKLEKNERLILRKSGTEPVIRLMIEGKNIKKISKYANFIISKIKKFNF